MKPGSPEWARVVSASKVAAILALSPWESQRSMWHLMRGEIPPAPESRPMRRGNMLENAVLDWWLADNPEWEDIGRQVHYSIDPEWCTATPDMLVRHRETGEEMLVDAKTTGTDDDWIDGEPPVYYAASSMWQLAMAPGVERVCLAALFGRPFDLRSYYVTRDDDIIDGLVSRCRAFWESLTDDDAAPALSDHPAEYDVVRTVHPEIDRDLDVTIPDDIAERYLLDLAHEKRVSASKARLLDLMGRARIAKNEAGQHIARRQPKGDAVTLVRVAALPELGA